MNRPIAESYWVEPGRFLAGAYPGSFNTESARARIDAFLDAGIDAFIDLTQSHEIVPYETILKEQAALHKVDALYHRIAIRDHDIPSNETMVHILDTLDAALRAGRNMYLHCWGGIGRTGLTVGCYLVRRGRTNEQALTHIDRLFKTMPKNLQFTNSPETEEQIQFVLNWREIPSAQHKSKQNICEG